MIRSRNQHDATERDLVALADGSLSAARRARVERAVAVDPELKRQVSAQRRVLAAIGTVGAEPMPGPLRARLELARNPRPAPRRWPRLGVSAATGAVAAAAFAGVAVLAVGGGVTSPTVAAAATLGTRAPISATGATLPGVRAAGIAFPDWSYRFGLTASGARHDSLGGRTATTVYYAGDHGRIAYTIVSGTPLASGAATSNAVWNGVRLHSFSASGRAVVTWLRDGHTCVLSGPRPLLKTMLGLASWKRAESRSAAPSTTAASSLDYGG